MNNEQNIAFMHDQRRIEAEKRLHKAVDAIRGCLSFDGSAGYYLTVLPWLLKELEQANDNLITVEATVEAEVCGKEKWHG